MDELLSLKDFAKRWQLLLSVDESISKSKSNENNAEHDYFDCTSLALPPLHQQVESLVPRFVQEWQDLDARRIERDNYRDEEQVGEENDMHPKKKSKTALPHWYRKHIRLPEQFDYSTKQNEPPSQEDAFDDKVISLEDPTVSTSYHQELWNLFKAIPTVAEIQEATFAHADLPNTQKLKAEIDEAFQKNARVDAHALSRLRMNDRHELPPALQTQTYTSTIRFECWRRQPKRGSSPDSNRMVVEFLGTQTLLDFHKVIVEMTEDDLWKDDPGENGVFFIENVFYTVGEVDYTGPIQKWLDASTSRQQHRRAAHLGLESVKDIPVHSMTETLLEDIDVRLGVRYMHAHNGDVECSVFVTDMKWAPKLIAKYPILHDIWTCSYSRPDCAACQQRPASVATSTECELTNGHRALCGICCRELQLHEKAPNMIQDYDAWRSQADLSVGANKDQAF